MKRIKDFNMNYKDCIIAMANGNPGAARVMCEMIKHDPVKGQIGLCHLDDKEIYGSDIWVVYKDICKQDIKVFMDWVFDCNKVKEDLNGR